VRISRIALRNFRGVADTEVCLATDGVTVIEGPNEVGKSSFAEAIDLVFEQADSSSKTTVKAVKPVHLDEGAEVEVELTTGDYHIVYAKRWHKRPQTTLRVLAPNAENQTGRAAHDRMKEILEETLDASLWKALQYQQGTTIAQAALGSSRSLASALDTAATGGALGGAEEANLWEQVEAERLRYFTPGGKPTADRAHLDQEVAQSSTQAAQLRQELDRLDTAAERHHGLTAELVQLGEQLGRQRSLVDEYSEVSEQLAVKQRDVAALAEAAKTAAAQAATAQAAYEQRRRLNEDLRRYTEEVHTLNTSVQREAAELDATRTAHAVAVERRDGARQARRDAEAASRMAGEDYEYFREVLGLELLGERQQRVQQAERTLGETQAFLEGCPIDAHKLTEIEAAFVTAAEARARLTGESPSIRVEALRDVELSVDGEVRALHGGQVVEERATQSDLELVFNDLARITVVGGTGTRELQDAAAQAEERLTELYRAVRVAGDDALVHARSLEQRRRSAERDAEQADQVLKDDLRDLTPQLMVEKIDRARASTAAYRAGRPSETPLPPDFDEAHACAQRATALLDRASQLEEQREQELDEPSRALETMRSATAEREVRIQVADQHQRAADDELSTARATSSDDELTRHRDELGKCSTAAEAEHREAASALAAQDPESVRVVLENARGVLERMNAEGRTLDTELTKVNTELDIKGEEGLQDQLDTVQSKLVQLERDKTQRDRRAAAAQFLYERLGAHRDAAKRSYVGPFRQQVENLGRIVFGPSLSVELDHEKLQITSRTLAGVTVPYDSLSTGAKEQLCVISRLACAALVNPPRLPGSPDVGAPVIIDDAFGYSDPTRLERLGAVLALAGRQSQVIVLTCTPDRYRNIGSASVVRLDGKPRQPTPSTADRATPGSIEAPLPALGQSEPKDVASNSAATRLILDCLGRAGTSLAKRDILDDCGLPAEAWPAIIAILLQQGAVCQEGTKRGARYHLSPPTADATSNSAR